MDCIKSSTSVLSLAVNFEYTQSTVRLGPRGSWNRTAAASPHGEYITSMTCGTMCFLRRKATGEA